MSVVPSLAPLLIGSLFYGKCRKCEIYWWLPRWLPCSLALCFIEKLENVKNVGGSLGGSLAHWFSVLWEMWKILENIAGFLDGSLAHWLYVL